MVDAPTPIPNQKIHSINLQYDKKNYKLTLKYENNNLNITCLEINSIPSNKYEMKYSKKDLEKISKFFILFDNIEDSLPELINQIEKKEIIINTTSSSLQITFKINILNCKDFTLELLKQKNDVDTTIESLCETVNYLKNENVELKKEINEIKKENMELKLKIQEINELKLKIQEINEIIKPIQEEKLRIEKIQKQFLESKIISEKDEKDLILKWINPKSNIKLTLLFQSSRDGDRLSTFYNKVSNKSSILIIIKSNYGYRFGGYTTLNFQNTNNYKQDEKAFIFSIDKKKKYNNTQAQYAIYTQSSYFAFGGGHDFYINDQFKTNSNYCGFPCSYSGGEQNEFNGGNSNFTVIECEAYHVEFE